MLCPLICSACDNVGGMEFAITNYGGSLRWMQGFDKVLWQSKPAVLSLTKAI